jgi:hypothetical protein
MVASSTLFTYSTILWVTQYPPCQPASRSVRETLGSARNPGGKTLFLTVTVTAWGKIPAHRTAKVQNRHVRMRQATHSGGYPAQKVFHHSLFSYLRNFPVRPIGHSNTPQGLPGCKRFRRCATRATATAPPFVLRPLLRAAGCGVAESQHCPIPSSQFSILGLRSWHHAQ